jgi:hypothetical protein
VIPLFYQIGDFIHSRLIVRELGFEI